MHHEFARALDEIAAGRKRSHWMWYVFPQIDGLGASSMSRRFAVVGLDEAEAFLNHPVLGTDYIRIADEVWRQVVQNGVTVHALFGSPDDAKLVSSLTLFAGAARRMAPGAPKLAGFIAQCDAVLDAARAEGLDRCGHTEALLKTSD